jgi:hypothetical protein
MAPGSRPEDARPQRGQVYNSRVARDAAGNQEAAGNNDEPAERQPQQTTRQIRPEELGLPPLARRPQANADASRPVSGGTPPDAESTTLLPRQARGERRPGGLGGALAPSPRPGETPPRSQADDQATQVFRRPGSLRKTPTPAPQSERTELVTPAAMAAARAAAAGNQSTQLIGGDRTQVVGGGGADRTQIVGGGADRTQIVGGGGADRTQIVGGTGADRTQVIRRPEDMPRIDPALIPGGGDGGDVESTQLINRVGGAGQPVFVDSSGKRGKLLKILVRVAGVIILLFFAGIIVSLLGGGPSTMRIFSKEPTQGPSPSAASQKSTGPKTTPGSEKKSVAATAPGPRITPSSGAQASGGAQQGGGPTKAPGPTKSVKPPTSAPPATPPSSAPPSSAPPVSIPPPVSPAAGVIP